MAIIQKSVKFAGADTDVPPQLLDEIEYELTALKAGEIKQIAVRSEQSLGMQTPLIVAIAATLGLLLAVMGLVSATALLFAGDTPRVTQQLQVKQSVKFLPCTTRDEASDPLECAAFSNSL